MAREISPPSDVAVAERDALTVPAVLARQGIYDVRSHLVAYELLFRPASDGGVQLSDGDAATARVLVTAFSDVGLDTLVGSLRAFVNVPYVFLTSGYCETLPPGRVVLEILEDVEIDHRVLDVARSLVAAGHTLALDDFVFRDGVEPLIELASIVKLDVLALTPHELADHVERLRHFDVELLAEKVESVEQLAPFREMGFVYFQGFALQRPVVVRARTNGANSAVLTEILSAVHRPDATAAELVETVSRDPSIAYSLLRILNSAHLSLVNPVTSLRQALVLLGLDGLRNWATMMVMSRLASGNREGLSNALIRAKMCELCAAGADVDRAVAFTAGLLSALPDTLDQSLAEIVEQLGLGPELRRALLDLDGPTGRVLAWVLAYEHGDADGLARLQAPPMIAASFVGAVEWSTGLTSMLLPTAR